MAASRDWQQCVAQWERPLTSMETFYDTMGSSIPDGGLAHWIVSSGLNFTFTGPDTEDLLIARLEKAWTEVRFRYPVVATKIEAGKKVYVPLTAENLESWLKQTFRIHRDQTIDQAFSNAVKSPTMVLHYFPETSHLLLQATHDHIDGRGVLYLWDAFFTALKNPLDIRLGDEVQNLPPSEDQLLSVPLEPSKVQHQDAKDLTNRFLVADPIGMPVIVSGPPGPSLRRELRLSVEVSGAVSRSCKARGVTVTSAWHAAIVLATQKIQGSAAGHSAGKNWVSLTNFDLRKYFPDGFETRRNAIGVYHTGLPFQIERPGERGFDDILSEIQRAYKTALDGEKVKVLSAYIWPVLELFGTMTVPPSTPVQSSLGIFDNFLDHTYGTEWAVEDVWVADSMLTPEIETFLWRWKEQIVLSGSCNSAYYSDGDVDNFLSRVRDELLVGLGVEY